MITIMTCVYNRAELMKRLYDSLCRQTDKGFEWLIIDDGSKDQLDQSVDEWKKAQNGFEIRYFYQQNGGKHRAWNNGVKKAAGDYIFVVDSDDYIVDDAVEKISGWISQIDEDKKFAGVSGCKAYKKDGKYYIYGAYPANTAYVDASNLQRHRPKLTGDKAEVYRTKILQEYLFPEFEGEKFCSEDVVFHRIARDGYILRWFPDGILIGEYLEDGLTQSIVKRRMEYIKGYTYSVQNGGKYDQFPYNYLSMGEYIWTLNQNQISTKIAAQNIQISYFKAIYAKVWFGIKQFRRRIIDNVAKNK